MKKPEVSTMVIGFLIIVLALQVYCFFSRLKTVSQQELQVQIPISVSTSSLEDTPLEVHDMAMGVLRLQDDPYCPLVASQKTALLESLSTYESLQKELQEEAKEMEGVFTVEQLQYIRYSRWNPSLSQVSVDSSKGMSIERQLVEAARAAMMRDDGGQ